MARSREGHEDKGRRVHGSPFLAQELDNKSFNIKEIKHAFEKIETTKI